jgi:hypothetical protein
VSAENPLVVVNRSPPCNQDTGQCAQAAIIRLPTQIGVPSVCYLRVDPGPCGRDLIRVYYDSRVNRCKHFSFSGLNEPIAAFHSLTLCCEGCGGNANRFVSIKNCYHICNPGYRTRILSATPAPPTTTEACFAKTKKKVKLNVTSVQQIEVEMK